MARSIAHGTDAVVTQYGRVLYSPEGIVLRISSASALSRVHAVPQAA
jgi:hypothetical protein